MTAKTVPVSSLPEECRKPRRGKPPCAAKSFSYWQVCGLSWKGNYIKRDGKRVTCGHEHKSAEACNKCLAKMKKEKPGNCPTYRVQHIEGYLVAYRK